MPSFQYKALQADGTLAEGQIEAGGRQEAFRQMAERGLRPVTLAEKTVKAGKTDAAVPSFNFKSNKVSSRDLENFTRLLSNLLAAGVPLSRALVILCKEASSPAAAAQWKQIHASVIDGVTLADAMAKSPDTFPRVYTAMVEAGETGGFLDLVLAQIADFQAREKELRSKVTTAMLYPVILFVLATCVLVFLMVFFIPKFQLMFSQLPGAKLPTITQIIIGISRAMIHYGLWMLLGIVVAGIMAKTWLASEKGKRIWENLVLRSPIIGPLTAQFAMARFCRMLGTLLGAGVPLVQALNVARKSIGNQTLVDAVTNSIETVKEGGQLGKSLGECRNLFSSSVLEMISVAEESGKLDAELVRIAAVTEADLDRELKTAVALAEPLMLFVIAGLIGTIFIGMVLPIFSMQDYIK
jgi:type II secretory pathway component PulF